MKSCPFCGHVARESSDRCRPGSCTKASTGRIGRAALAAVRAAAIAGTVTLQACSSHPLYGGPPLDGSPDSGNDAGGDASSDAGGDAGGDASSDAGSDAAADGGSADSG